MTVKRILRAVFTSAAAAAALTAPALPAAVHRLGDRPATSTHALIADPDADEDVVIFHGGD